MSVRKGWGQLSDAYRKRLERGGITRSAYERGESIKKARGHESTPERPSDAYTIRGRERFKNYLQRVSTLRRKVIDRKVRLFQQRFKWNDERARQFVMEGGAEVPRPGRQALQTVLDMDDEEFERFIPRYDDVDRKEWRFLWYH